ncbi:MAG: NAD(P)/FAD-dependent oxidoreductase [Salinisphaeraceae bacterium]|nr:NAD(P)/FAD-dependent oxidoreductase [Salinisphaeraceae bacterium]
MSTQHVDVLIIGAGVSGIGLACHLSRNCPEKSLAILERRADMGGTWDLFKYPGIRSDSDMFTFGYNFKPWINPQTLADGPSIKNYVREAAAEHGVEDKIHFNRKVVSSNWSTTEGRWTVKVQSQDGGKEETWTCNFLLGCTGYYNYDQGYRPEFPGEDDFKGEVIHPQHWPEDLDYKGKKVVVIGSGATAVTLIPAMADDTAHITMLQRSPTYVFSLPAIDPISSGLQKRLPEKLAYKANRTRNINFQRFIYQLSQKQPQLMRRFILKSARKQLGKDVDIRHFSPRYNPWDQRMCVVPDGDLFNVLRDGKASIVTDHIERFTENGILLKSGKELEADIIVSATGLSVQMMGGSELNVDGRPVDISDRLTYKSVMVEGVPNYAVIFGYINASWTLKVDIAADYICRLINHMDEKGYDKVVPDSQGAEKSEDTVFGALSSGYVQRAANSMPRQGLSGPWRVSQNYVRDVPMLRFAPIEDEHLRFDDAKPAKNGGLVQQIGSSFKTALGLT